MMILVITSSCSKTELYEEELTAITLENSDTAIEIEFFELVNMYRAERGLSRLKYNNQAKAYTVEHNLYMISKNEISHDNFIKRSSKLSVDIHATRISENVGRNFTTAQGLFEAFLASDSHLKNIEGDFVETAISVYVDNDGAFYLTQVFIK